MIYMHIEPQYLHYAPNMGLTAKLKKINTAKANKGTTLKLKINLYALNLVKTTDFLKLSSFVPAGFDTIEPVKTKVV